MYEHYNINVQSKYSSVEQGISQQLYRTICSTNLFLDPDFVININLKKQNQSLTNL